jgi:hypothetical protein
MIKPIRILKFTVVDKSEINKLSKFQKFICRLFEIPPHDPIYKINAKIEVSHDSDVFPSDMFVDNFGNKWITISRNNTTSEKTCLVGMANYLPIKNFKEPTELAFIASVYKENSTNR